MQRRTSIQISSLIIFLSIVNILVQFSIYYLFSVIFVVWGISALIMILCCHVLLEQSGTYEACFQFSLLNIFISLIIIVLSYLGGRQSYLPYSGTMLGIAVINWLIPSIHCLLRYMFDYGIRIEEYPLFYRKHTALFLLFYLGILCYGSFSPASFSGVYPSAPAAANFVPFEIITAQIEAYLNGTSSLSEIMFYLSSRILVFLPFGYFITLILRRKSRLIRFASLLALPMLIQFLQFFIIPSRCDIDDVIYGLLGGLFGALAYYLKNTIFRIVTGRPFLLNASDSFYRNTLHF